MKTIKLSCFLNSASLESLLLLFFNIDRKDNDFYISGSFKESKFATIPYERDILFSDVASKLSEYYELPFYNAGAEYRCDIENDLNMDFDRLVNSLRTKIFLEFSRLEDVEKFDVYVALAIFILRGSPDFSRNLFAVDIKRVNETSAYLDSLSKILYSTSDLIKVLNWNFRDLQAQFVSGENLRNTQLRLDLNWAYIKLYPYFIELNKYKANILNRMSNEISKKIDIKSDTRYNNFIKRISYYRRNILGKNISDKEMIEMRAELFGDGNIAKKSRSVQIKLLVKNMTEDVCSACNKKFDTLARTFIMPIDNRPYFEYHHVLSFANDRENLDITDNLVKLCPVCHRAMTPNRAFDDYQKELIKNMLEDREDVLDFCKMYFSENSLDLIVEKVHENLR